MNLLGRRATFAKTLLDSLDDLHEAGIYHGDFHTKNIILQPPTSGEFQLGYLCPFKIIDFGTSHFADKGFSLERHYKIIVSTIDELLAPFKIQKLSAPENPEYKDWEQLHLWLDNYIEDLVGSLLYLGYGQYDIDFRLSTSRLGPQRILYPRVVEFIENHPVNKSDFVNSVVGWNRFIYFEEPDPEKP